MLACEASDVHTHFLAGVVLAWVVSYVSIGVSFCIAYLIHRREREDFLFGLHSLALALYSVGLAASYRKAGPAAASMAVTIAVTGVLLATAFFVHFALLYARIRELRRFMRPIYAVAAMYGAANLIWPRSIFYVVDPQPIRTVLWGLPVSHVGVHATMLGVSFCLLVATESLAAVGLIGKAVFSGRREGIAPLVGAALLTASAIHDALLAPGYIRGTWLTPFGSTAFVLSIAGALLVRSSRLGKELTEQSLELQERTRELRRSYEDLREAQHELTRKNQLAAVGELAAVIAHEVRNPLAIISNAVAGLGRHDIGQQDRETLISILKEESSRLNRLVGDLLRYARPITVHRQLISVREVAERTIASTTPKDGVSIELGAHGGVHEIWGDPNLLRQVFDNLVDNALQAMDGPAGGQLGIVLRPRTLGGAEGVRVEVRDTGEGMDAQVRQRAKDPFFTTRPSGTGLGLAIVERIVEAHGGHVSIASEPGQGTTVDIFLPIAAPLPPPAGVDLAYPTADENGDVVGPTADAAAGSSPPPSRPGSRA